MTLPSEAPAHPLPPNKKRTFPYWQTLHLGLIRSKFLVYCCYSDMDFTETAFWQTSIHSQSLAKIPKRTNKEKTDFLRRLKNLGTVSENCMETPLIAYWFSANTNLYLVQAKTFCLLLKNKLKIDFRLTQLLEDPQQSFRASRLLPMSRVSAWHSRWRRCRVIFPLWKKVVQSLERGRIGTKRLKELYGWIY